MKYLYVVGNKASKSLSPIIFNYWFKKYKIKAKYSFLETDNKGFDLKIKKILNNNNVVGLNITIPFKQKIIKHLDELDKHSKKINAVNCVVIKKKIKGINTDWIGYYKTIPKKNIYKNSNIVLIGYGGAALAIHYVLKARGFKNLTIINRTKRKIRFQKKNQYTISIKKLEKYLSEADLIINTTPLNPIKNKHKKLINKKTILSDLVYKPKDTGFLKAFKKNKKMYGISMLLQQAVPCFKQWFGFSPSVDRELIRILDKKIK